MFLRFKKSVKGFKLWNAISKKVIISRDVILDEEHMLKSGGLYVNPVKGKVDEDRNIVLVELDVGNTSTKLSVEEEHAEPGRSIISSTQNEEHLHTYFLARDRENREIHPLV